MLAPQRLEIGIGERLHADRDAIDAGGPVAGEVRRLDARRIGLERHLGIGGDRPQLCDPFEHASHGCGRHQRRRAAAEEDAGDFPARRARAEPGKLARQSVGECQFIDRLMAHMRVEIAIGAFGPAEGPMHIDAKASEERIDELPEGHAHGARSACLAAGSISPKVSLLPVGQEHRIIAEAARAARRPDQRAMRPGLRSSRHGRRARRPRAR